MDINFDFPMNVIMIITGGLAWSLILFLAYRTYKKQIDKLKVWKIPIVIFVGLFTFSITLDVFQTMVKLPILPLGVWILYFFLRGKRWQVYRSFAWLGYWANFLFLAATFLTMPIHHVVYPKDEPATYISEIEEASIIHLHPSAKESSLNKDSLLKQLDTMRQETINSQKWYNDTYENMDTNKKSERFPYQLIGSSSKWGSGIHTMIFIENDGRGILITTSKNQLYFRSNDSLLEGVE
jgi:hypothetical protein